MLRIKSAQYMGMGMPMPKALPEEQPGMDRCKSCGNPKHPDGQDFCQGCFSSGSIKECRNSGCPNFVNDNEGTEGYCPECSDSFFGFDHLLA